MSGSVRESYREDLGFEVLDGKIVNMSPANTGHNRVTGRIYRRISNYLDGKRCEAFLDGPMVHFSERDKVVPDIMVVCRPEIIKANGVYGAPDLVVEILSPFTTFRDRGYKLDLYEKSGVREYWIVDIKNHSVEVYRLTDERYILDQAYVQHTPDDLALLNEGERQPLPGVVHSSIFADMTIILEEIFENV